jgi:hypothetical protein
MWGTEPRTNTQKTSALLMGPQQVRSAKTLKAKLLLLLLLLSILLEINNVFTQKKNSELPDGFTGRR